ncbi:MAG TPA: hypothetical protein VIJ93_13350 [bacterium]
MMFSFVLLWVLAPLAACAQCPNNPTLTPDNWTNGASGSASFSAGVYTLIGNGSNPSGQDHEQGYIDFTTLSGNGQIQARVNSVSGPTSLATSLVAGIFIRSGSGSGADGGLLWVQGNGSQYEFAGRVGNNAGLTQIASGTSSLPFWLQLQNSGSNLNPAVSTDGNNWTPLPTYPVPVSEFGSGTTVTYGLMVWSGSSSSSQPATAVFDNVCISTPNFTPIPTLTSTPIPTATPTNTPTPTTSGSPTPTPTFTPSSTGTLAATPTITPTPPSGVRVWPNPFTPASLPNDRTHFLLPNSHGSGSLLIADLKRRRVRSLDFAAGVDVQWDGKDNDGMVVLSGVYLYLLESDGTVRRGTVTVMR